MTKQFDSLGITGTISYKRASKIQISIGGHVLEIVPHETAEGILLIKNLSGNLARFPRLDDREETEIALVPYSGIREAKSVYRVQQELIPSEPIIDKAREEPITARWIKGIKETKPENDEYLDCQGILDLEEPTE